MARIRTIFFDFGNVVAFFDHRRALARLTRYTDMEATELALILYGGVLEEEYESGRIQTSEYIAAARADGRLRCTDQEFIDAFVDIFTGNDAIISLFPRLKHHYRLVLASNTNDAHFSHYRMQFADALRHFSFLGVSHEARARKPHPEFFQYCQQFAECEPGECLFIDDLPSNIAAAEAFGWKGIVYHPQVDMTEALARYGVRLDHAVEANQ